MKGVDEGRAASGGDGDPTPGIVVVGAGGLGSYVGATLARAGHDVTLVARGDHLAAMRADGLHVETVEGDFHVRPTCVESAFEVEAADLAFVATKAFSLEEVAPQLLHLAERGATVVSLLNGVTAGERLVALGLDPERFLDAIAYMTAFRIAPGKVQRHAEHHRLVVGSSTGERPRGSEAAPDGRMGAGAAIATVERAFAKTTVGVERSDDILVDLWRKMAVVCSLATVCAVTGKAMGPIRTHRYGADLQRRAIAEVIALGRARGAALHPGTEAEISAVLDAFPADFVPSVIHDLRSGRRTEMEELGGVIAGLSHELGLEAPLHEAATAAVQLQEG